MTAPTPLVHPEMLGPLVGEEIADDDARAVSVLSIATTVVQAYARQTWTGDAPQAPQAVRDVILDVSSRAWTNPEGLTGDDIDDGSRRWSEKAGDVFYLTEANRLVLDSLRAATGRPRGLYTIATTRADEADDTVYVPTGPPPSGDPFPWYAADDPLVQ